MIVHGLQHWGRFCFRAELVSMLASMYKQSSRLGLLCWILSMTSNVAAYRSRQLSTNSKCMIPNGVRYVASSGLRCCS